MKTVEEYLLHAERAEYLAAQSDAPAHKAQILKIAQMWRELAKQRRRLIEGSGGAGL
jgi:dethiobiotin synthetase